MHKSVSVASLVNAVLRVAQHIAGNILHEIFYVAVADKGTVKGRVQALWPLTVEAYRLDSATTRLGGLTLSMLTDPSRPHQVFPLLKAKAKKTEWFCRALTFVLPHFIVTCATGTSPVCRRCPLYSMSLLQEV